MSRPTTLQHVIDKLNVGDALDLKNSFPGDPIIEQCYACRINPARYLSRAFKYPVTLLAAMFDSGCVISGSRALDFFVPGSATVDSDWDFYVPGYKESVADMVRALSTCGVTWNSEGDAISTALSQNKTVTVKRTVLESLCSWVSNMGPTEGSELMGERLQKVLSAFDDVRGAEFAEYYFITQDSTGRISVEPNESDAHQSQENASSYHDSSGKEFSMMRGSIQTKGGPQSVQLIIGCHYSGIRSCLSFIKDFYASHVQCFISGWCASHMYYYHASAKRPVRWESSYYPKNNAVEKAIRKYRQRGFEFFRADSMEPTIRRLKDSEAFFFDFSDIYRPFLRSSNLNLVNAWLIERRKNVDSIHWVEFDRRIFALYSPMDACLRDRNSYATASYGLPLTRLRCLSDIIALNTPGSDDLRNQSFRSSVRKTIAGSEWHIVEAARSGTVYCSLHAATPWSWVL